jgi:hypothetical protein
MTEESADEPLAKKQKIRASNVEPSYMLDLMYKLSQKLQKFACQHGVNAPQERLAWLLTMNAVLAKSQDAALQATRDALWIFYQHKGFEKDEAKKRWVEAKGQIEEEAQRAELYMAMNIAQFIAYDIDKNIAWQLEKTPRLGVTIGAMIQVAKKKAQEELLLSFDGKKAYRVAERAILEALVENFEIFFNFIYLEIMNKLSIEDCHLKDEKALVELNTKHLVLLLLSHGSEQACLLACWLGHMQPTSIFPKPERAIFTCLRDDLYFYPVVKELLICQKKEEDNSFSLCNELIFIILDDMVRWKIIKGDKAKK